MDELLTYLFDGQSHLLAAPVAAWLASSRRFTAFVSANQTKIRKKIRTSADTDRLRDLQLELETAYLLLREHSLSIQYEAQHPHLGRSPDFAVSFTTSLLFMVEVTRLRPPGAGKTSASQETSLETLPAETSLVGPRMAERFTDMLCGKLGQLLPQRSNLLIVGIDGAISTPSELPAAMLRIQIRAEESDPNILQKHGFHDRAGFFNRYQRLSALLLRGIPLQTGDQVILWENPQAKYPLPARVRTTLLRSHIGVKGSVS